ncbi:MAG: Lrp/AsnC ligand binding domain-containing protein [Deltaproteobacteria bacterium]|jgi:DNA-binding Lrp family transcriptional regulator|nr:Lrp/AsnC ligand binding domain-containing protein [Deltaproteobacteria bacterium]MBT4266023.1 Lrp/AsnC ligand binding domain-containing protein [Deltaproteobacteria bacterium]MBT4641821.1 Lrp/AsnC ligand binding domain-containing protein [Deltaproteobacteria bacterium]MBT6500766.1 Lrp/AsnC ligand binding domain-containing protein [Deltaproteobacteria bacterium]MBT6615878.1 Lrp/AsnC ligand binding domain-containing protein [Deltaproteobacteria bacterium]
MTSVMSVAYILISVKPGTAREVYYKLQKLPNIQQVEAVTGPYDIIATVHGSDLNAIGNIVIDRILKIEGISNSMTCSVIQLEN